MTRPTRASLAASRNAGISPADVVSNASILAMRESSAAMADAITAIEDVEAAANLAEAQTAVGGGLGAALVSAKDSVDTLVP